MSAFSEFTEGHRGGNTARDLDDALAKVIAAVRQHGVGGKLSYTITIKPVKKGQHHEVLISDAIKISLPEGDRGVGFFYTTEKNELSREDPLQVKIDFKAVAQPDRSIIEVAQPGRVLRTVGESE